jgi:sugar O-acyltransferase (sialic acid O-acetyltransferase NeuD family)
MNQELSLSDIERIIYSIKKVMKNLIIIGARGFGREIYNLAKECSGYNTEYVIKGFLDDKKDALSSYANYPLVIDAVESYRIQPDDIFICALGDVVFKKKYAQMIIEKGGEFTSLIHPTVYISQNTTIGKGCIICRNSFISCDSHIGDFVTIQPFSVLGHDVVVGNGCHLNTYAFLGGFVTLEDMVTIHTGGIVLPHKIIKGNAIVGAGSVTIRNVNENTTVFGIPAIRINPNN